MLYIIIAVVSFLLSFFLTYCIRAYALKHNVIDVPNQRSSHSVPTPRGGGVAIVLSFSLVLAGLYTLGFIPGKLFISLFAAGAVTAIVGFLDDHGHIAARWRLLMHMLSSVIGLYFLSGDITIDLLGYPLYLGWIFLLPGILYLTWMLNLYNFMDGINGLASMEAIFFSLSSILLLYLSTNLVESNSLIMVYTLMAAAATGFILWNFPKAKIFMGDAGSGFLGITLGLLVLHSATLNIHLFFAEICLLGLFIVDATITLLRRFLGGKKVYEAHASHCYQIISRRLSSHARTTSYALCINLFWLLPWSLMIATGMITGLTGIVVAWLPLLVIAIAYGAGVKDKLQA